MAGEVRAVLEIELVLTTLLRGAGGDESLLPSVVQDGRAELLVYEDAGMFLRHSVRHGGPDGVEDHSS